MREGKDMSEIKVPESCMDCRKYIYKGDDEQYCQAMRMREIRFGGSKVMQMAEYRLVPMMTCSVKIGEELSAAALTRGLGSPVKRTNVCRIGFHAADIVMFLLCAAALGWIIWRSVT